MIFIGERERERDGELLSPDFGMLFCRKSVPCRCWWIQSADFPANKILKHYRGESEIVCSVFVFVLEIPFIDSILGKKHAFMA